MTPSRPFRRTVVIAIHEGAAALDLAGPMDVFSAANTVLGEGHGYQTLLISHAGAPTRLSNGTRVLPDLSYDDAPGAYDIVLAAGGPSPSEDPVQAEWLRTAAPLAGVHGSICTGAFALGRAGLLDGHTVTTHWEYAAELAARYPAARVEPDRIYVRSGALITSAGVTSGIDLALALVAGDHGAELALQIARRLVVLAQRQGGQSQFSPYLTAPLTDGSPIARAQAFVMDNVGHAFTVQALADAAGISARSFARHFRQHTGMTPHDFIEQARIDAARRVLESTRLPLKSVAYDCGFGNADNMRRVFMKRLQVSPADYRQRFLRDE
ncbi:GlxA family transcriptional regulator [Achromobacter pestifer]